jgi:N-hydroxyarylamine O-acetyltransferase
LDVRAYLDRIGYREPTAADESTLLGLHVAHLHKVPFENLDIHLGREIVLDEMRLFDKVVRRKRGGFCYELNGLFAELLRELGFRVTLLSARVVNDGKVGPEFDHLALRVDLDRPWLCDVGFGDSFLEPLVLAEGQTVEGGWRYRLARDGADWTLSRGEPWEPSFVFTLTPRSLQDFEPMCRFHQSSPDSPFTRKRVCTLAVEGGRTTLSNDRLILTHGTERHERRLADEDEIRDVLHRVFDVEIGSVDR